MNSSPIGSGITSANLNFSQILVGNEEMTATWNHLNIIVGHNFVFSQGF